MTRYVLIRGDGDVENVVPETPLPLEANLHDALTKHPELLPAEDLGLGRTVVVGRQAALASGYADLILLDDRGQVCLVEVKKEGTQTRDWWSRSFSTTRPLSGQEPAGVRTRCVSPLRTEKWRLGSHDPALVPRG
jgi:RecB family endonuclease NucS